MRNVTCLWPHILTLKSLKNDIVCEDIVGVTWTSLGNLWSPRCSLCKEVASCWRELGLGQNNSLHLCLFKTKSCVWQLWLEKVEYRRTCYVCDYLPFLELFAFEDLNIRQPKGRHKVSWAHETPVLEKHQRSVLQNIRLVGDWSWNGVGQPTEERKEDGN